MFSSKILKGSHGFGRRGDGCLMAAFPLRFSSLRKPRGQGVPAGQDPGEV